MYKVPELELRLIFAIVQTPVVRTPRVLSSVVWVAVEELKLNVPQWVP